ncbi:hypothetical protein MNEG_16556 [Monoraphidium neglectum]|uniref:Histone deacetylase domain-containing protein n=1 Tax=Monoraphidium neglectum TaxID=145388 RepID=A0A0D2K5F5_9CHLO|nr:hypothetical protein MNEG_16556 [Monoraphidium neglectum]KIY91408.1 hypothetical protein MNEG_16556 [Monoraphidium neglectum]|eukprot:XP_013890428.1 hypothetical protein MNEG_16556 [Monoraphidium neglectum]
MPEPFPPEAARPGHPECVEVLLQAKVRTATACDGCPPLIMAVCGAAVPARRGAALRIVELLLAAGADVLQRRGAVRAHCALADDSERTALHWAAEVGFSEAVPALLAAGAAATAELARQQQQDAEAMAAVAAADGGAPPPELPAPPVLQELADSCGDLPLHLAARGNHLDVVSALLAHGGGDGGDGEGAAAAAAAARNKLRDTPLHSAARRGAARAAAALLAAAPGAAEATNKHGLTPADLAARRGHTELAALLRPSTAAAPAAALPPLRGKADPALKTLVLAPPECGEHYTAPQPVRRGGPEAPPENTARLDVLLAEAKGSLQAAEFEGRVEWGGGVAAAPMGDLLRVHDWNYLQGLQAACASIPDAPAAVGRVDADTAISHRTFRAARAAAGAVLQAVDQVVAGQASLRGGGRRAARAAA